MSQYNVYSCIGILTHMSNVVAKSSEKAALKVLQAHGYYGKLLKTKKDVAHIKVKTPGNFTKSFVILNMQKIDNFYITVTAHEQHSSYKYKLITDPYYADRQMIASIHDAEEAKLHNVSVVSYVLPIYNLSLQERLTVLNNIGIEIGKCAVDKLQFTSGQMQNLLDMFAKQLKYRVIH